MTRKRRLEAVYQILPSFSAKDAIGNEVLLMQEIVRDLGLRSEIFYEQSTCPERGRPFGELKRMDQHRVALLYHFSIASTIPMQLAPEPHLKLVRYHNITPARFFVASGEQGAYQACAIGRQQIPMVALMADEILAASEYNAAEMAPFARSPVSVAPVLRDYDRIVAEAENATLPAAFLEKPYLLFVGRLSPNKCQHDLIELLHLAKRFVREDLRLVLVGGGFAEGYAKRMMAYAEELGLRVGRNLGETACDVMIPGSISDREMAGLYRHASLFACMSEHEGFGVPLVEAMAFSLPILANPEAAVPETLGEGGLLIAKSDLPAWLGAIRAVIENPSFRSQCEASARRRYAELNLDVARRRFTAWLERFMWED